MPRAKLTDRLLKSLAAKGAPSGAAQVDYVDPSLPVCWGARVTRDGRVTFFVRYTAAGGRRRRISLGWYAGDDLPTRTPVPEDLHRPTLLTLHEARQRAMDVARQIYLGEDPARRPARGTTVREVAAAYLERYARPRKRSWRQDERNLQAEVLPRVGDLPACAVTRAEVRAVIEPIVARGSGYMALGVLATMRSLFAWAEGEELVPENPTLGVRSPIKPRPRQRVLLEEEIQALWAALDEDGRPAARAMQFCLLVPVRRIAAMHGSFAEVREAEEGAEWLIPEERNKAGVPLLMYLPPPALDLLGRIPRDEGVEEFFPSPQRGVGPIRSWNQVAAAIQRSAVVADWRPHDLRRAWATYARREGIDRDVVRAVLGHAPAGVTQRHYDLYGYRREKLAALDHMAAYFSRLVARR